MKIKTLKVSIILIALFLGQLTIVSAQSVGINDDGSEPDSRAILEVKSTDKGVLLPKLSEAERDALCRDVPFGMIIFNTSDSTLQVFMDTAWYPISFGTPQTAEQPLVDIDGNYYDVVGIGNQVWMAENLRTTTYNDGTPIELKEDNTEWSSDNTGAYCWYNNDEATYADTYGALYNFYAVETGKLCPAGWHVPTDSEWRTLEKALGMSQAEAGAIGWRGTNEGSELAGNASLWYNGDLVNGEGFESSGFDALPADRRKFSGTFNGELGQKSFFWTASPYNPDNSYARYLYYNYSYVYRLYFANNEGYSVRCIKD